MVKVIILQGQLPEYRIPIFNLLAKQVNLTVVHTDKMKEQCEFGQVILRKFTIGPFILQQGLFDVVKNAEVVIAMFDLRWISILWTHLLVRRKRTSWIYWGHGMGKSRWLSKVRLFFAKKSDALILYSLGRIKPFISGGIEREKIFEAPNTLEILNHLYCDTCERSDFIFVGSLYKEKLIDELILAFSIFAENFEEGVLHIVGKGACKDELISLARDKGVDSRVYFHGQILDEQKLKPIFDSSLAYVSPGVVGLGVLHAFAYGVPVVTKIGLNHGPEFDNLNPHNSYLYNGGVQNLSNILLEIKNDKNTYFKREAAYEHYSKKRLPSHMVSGFLKAIKYTNDKKNS